MLKNGNPIVKQQPNYTTGKKWNISQKLKNTDQKDKIQYTIILSGLIVIIIIICAFTIRDTPTICSTPECQSAALEIKSYIDETQNPCQDFYKFACGSFIKNFTYKDPNSIQSVKNIIQNNIQADIKSMLEEPIDIEEAELSFNLAKKFYKTCMNQKSVDRQGLRKIKEVFKIMGGWPLLEGPNWNEDNFSWITAIRKLRAIGINCDFFFNVTIEIDPDKLNRYVLSINSKVYSPSAISPNTKTAYIDYMTDVVNQFNPINANLWKELSDILDFLLTLAKISEQSKKANRTYAYHPYTIPELQHQIKTINWYEYFEGILGKITSLHPDDIVNLKEPVFIYKLGNELMKTEKRIIANFIGWQVLQQLISYLPSNILNKAYDYLRKVNGKYDQSSRWNLCVEATRNRFSSVLNLAYITYYFDDNLRSNATNLIRNIKNEFRRELMLLDWIDEETKRKILGSLLSSIDKIYSAKDFYDILHENSIYNNVKLDENKLLQAVLDIDLISLDLYYNQLRQPVKDQWVKSQQFLSGVKIEYSAIENKLKYPLGLLHGIYYNPNRPDYINYGLLGSITAHQITHIFEEARYHHADTSKSNNMKLIRWWSTISLDKYNEKVECLSNHYKELVLKDLNDVRSNSLLTKTEDVADLAGIKVAYYAYLSREWMHGSESQLPGLKYTSRQLFWISNALQFCSKFSADYLKNKYLENNYHHSPNEFRVNGPLRNLNEFSYDFSCKLGSYMNPYNKCEIW